MGVNQNDLEVGEVEEVIREAVFQEPFVARIDEITLSKGGSGKKPTASMRL